MRVDLHVHTSASFDCLVPPEAVAKRCASLGLHPIFITDHDTIAGARALAQSLPDGQVVVGQEISTSQGEIIGLFLTEAIPAGLDARSSVERIKAQGGLVYLQHAYDQRRRCLEEKAIDALADRIDVVEVFNGRSSAEANTKAGELAETLAAARGAGSDSHRLSDLGKVYVDIEEFAGAQDFLRKLADARIVTQPNRLLMRAAAGLRHPDRTC